MRSAESSIFPVIAAKTESSQNWIAVKPSVPFVLATVSLTYTHPFAPMLFNMFIPLSPMIFMLFVKLKFRGYSSGKFGL